VGLMSHSKNSQKKTLLGSCMMTLESIPQGELKQVFGFSEIVATLTSSCSWLLHDSHFLEDGSRICSVRETERNCTCVYMYTHICIDVCVYT